MSRATESDHVTPRAAGSGADRAPDLDAEHDPAAARRASLAGLRREAAAPHGPAPAAKQREDQHRRAETYSIAGVRAAVILGAARFDERTAAIHTMIHAKPGDGGPALNLDIMRDQFADTFADLKRLRIEIWTVRAAAPGLQREVLRLGGALERFADAWRHAQAYAAQHGEELRQNPFWLKQELDDILGKVHLDPAAPVDHTVDERGHDEILRSSLEESMDAVLECARSLRMGLARGEDAILAQEVDRLIWQLKEIEAASGKGVDARIVRVLRARSAEVVQAVFALQQVLETRPGLAAKLDAKGIDRTLGQIQRTFR